MSFIRVGGFAAVLAFPILLAAGVSVRADDEVSTDKLGSRIGNIKFEDGTGKPFELNALKERKAIVVVFLNFECPVSTSYSDLLAQMVKTYAAKGVAFIGICTNDEMKLDQLTRDVKEFKLGFDVYLDGNRAAADAFKARVTPEAFVLDRNLYLRYRGRIDNGYSARLRRNISITEHDLQEALDAVLAGKDVLRPATAAIGCPLASERDTPKDGKVTYYRDVLPILQTNCQSCHRPGEIGPFSLLTYKQAVRWGDDLKSFTLARKMPPWKPVEGSEFNNERKLSEKEIATLAAWVDGGMAEGDPGAAPAPRKFTEGWQLGKPDLVLTVGDDFQVAPSGKDVFRCFVLPTNLTEDKYVIGMELRPGNPRIVHHALTFYDTRGKARELEQKEKDRVKKDDELDRGPGYGVGMGGIGFAPSGSLRGWAPGIQPAYTPEGTGFFLPKGSDVVLQVHYHRNGRLEKDRTQIGLYFAKEKVSKPFGGMVIPGRFVAIPSGDEQFKVHGTIVVNKDCEIHDIVPHMHMVGKKIKVTLTAPDGSTSTVIRIDDWDYNWQEMYLFKQPLKVKEGTRLDVEAVYDNSDKNPNNPNKPAKWVKFGEQTTDEMCFVFLGATSDKPGPYVIRKRPASETEEKKPNEESKKQ
jgi:mono/diheme cytochrome c family protein/peroxiredoxin